MRKTFYLILILLGYISNSFALTRGDVQIIEATENIQYLGEKITTNYFLIYQKPHDFILQNEFKENIQEIEKNINTIAQTTKNKITTQYILKFYRHNLEEMKNLALESPNIQDAQLMLDASESFSQGARSIAKQHQYQSTKKNEEMLVRCKRLIYLIESTSKSYMAFQIGLQNIDYTQTINQAIQKINKDLLYLSKYPYKYEQRAKLNQIRNIWNNNQYFFIHMNETTFPNLVLASNEYIQELLTYLEKHHKQNL
ncbi:MAG TPA: hypothetical protein ENK66_08385 [Arcobacter sp.]|nr:hypothetical protein [Arcobacter sp.]